MKIQEDLLDKYYRGETSEAEEKEIKEWFAKDKTESVEKDMFAYFQNENNVPDNLEESLFNSIQQNKRKQFKTRFISFVSAAAVLLVILSAYLNIQSTKKANLENQFLVMETALFQVSESIQPQESEEMLVLWVDNDIEIIVN